ncbi:uncharacterized protein APUU_40068S [Aspergillus puulaauensis]|uniref:C2H2-type domain-containing protein n=1 Tax=Aspergillus puulaauensis TaxID=1220207 RepID=A0A7R7XN22_9EURO|nr:uncharacterized protein APUU_40068S [Aspergillus puulaauensis]BCS23624.1 hypothetical protein APUU_40068S [Aspergillus puulaauensis]
MANGPPTRSSYDMATLADWGSALSPSCPNDGEAADESIFFPVPSIVDSAHQPPIFECKWLGCRSSACFRREADLIRHLKTIHIAPNAYPCPEPNCGVAFGRKDHLKAHEKTHQKPSHNNRRRRK